jgi:NAD(P)-dependent dehydrogenase (short-subunit alcohol dehydrogenase family)
MGRTILITGAGGQLGTAVTNHFIARQWSVVAVDRSPQDRLAHDRLHAYTCDLSDESDVERTFTKIFGAHGDVEAAAFLAGGFSMGEILDTGTKDIDRMISLNFKTAYHAARASIRHFQQNQGGNLVFIGAKPAMEIESAPSMVAYALSKSMVVRFAEVINAMKAKPLVRASVIAPSIIDTPANRNAMPDADFSAWVKPEAIGGAIEFILSEDGSNLKQPVFRMYNAS